MAVRKIIKIDEELCNGCGECIVSCEEAALEIIDGKARVVKEVYCDGLGACLGACPVGALTIEEREADDFSEEAVQQHLAATQSVQTPLPTLPTLPTGCPGAALRQRQPGPGDQPLSDSTSQLSHWPIQLTLVPPNAPFLQDADLLLVADCVPFAMADFHGQFLRGRPVVVGCPKLDDPQSYVDKLTAIIQQAAIRGLTIIHMEVPCCSGLCQVARMAVDAGGQDVPVREVTISVDGRVITEEDW